MLDLVLRRELRQRPHYQVLNSRLQIRLSGLKVKRLLKSVCHYSSYLHNNKKLHRKEFLGVTILRGQEGLGHVPRPRKFTIASIACIGTFPCGLPLAILTLDTAVRPVKNSRHFRQPNKISSTKGWTFYLEGQEGLEPSTPCLRGRCSNQLSYWPVTRANCSKS